MARGQISKGTHGAISTVQLPDRWRATAQVRGHDDQVRQVRRERPTKAAAINAVQTAIRELLDAQTKAQALAEAGDTSTTVGALVERAQKTPTFLKLAPGTRDEAVYTTRQLKDHGEIWDVLPRNVDLALLRSYLDSFTNAYGRNAAVRAKALLRKAFDLATEDRTLRVPLNPVTSLRGAIPNVQKRTRALDSNRVPTAEELEEFLSGVRADPRAQRLTVRRIVPKGKSKDDIPVNGLDYADLITFMFEQGTRIGEALGLRWSDVDLTPGDETVTVTGSVRWIKGQGTIRQDATKTKAGMRTIPLSATAVQVLSERREAMQPTDDQPVFGSPQQPNQWRHPGNAQKAIRKAFDDAGMDYASSHTARRTLITKLLDEGLPVGLVADVAGHDDLSVTMSYVGRGRATDQRVRQAMGAAPTVKQP